jgi:hypothetical protein
MTATTTITVSGNAPPVSQVDKVHVAPGLITLQSGGTQQFTAEARDVNNSAFNPQPSVIWSMKNNDTSAGNVDQNGLFTASAIGIATVVATMDGVSGEANITVGEIVPPPPDDTTNPVITIIGANPAEVLTGAVYADAGATAADNVDGDLTASIVTSGLPVNTGIAGTFTVTYSVADQAGNSASATRTVIVNNPDPEPGPVDLNIIASPAPGKYNATQSVVLTSGGTIRYTLDGTDPSCVTGSVYGSPITLKSEAVIKAISCSGADQSDIQEFEYEVEHEVDDDNLGNLVDDDIFEEEPGHSSTSTPSITLAGKVMIKSHDDDDDAVNTVTLPKGVKIRRSDGQSLDATKLTSGSAPEESFAGLGSGTVIDGALQWGIAGLGLEFDQPISLKIYVGADQEGKTLDIVRSTTGVGNWTKDGLSPSSCVVVSGFCDFNATKASFFAVTHALAASTNSGGNNSSGGGGGSSSSGGGGIPLHLLTQMSQPTGFLPITEAANNNNSATSEGQKNGQVLGEKTFGDGILIRGADKKIYVIADGKKYRIPNLTELRKFAGRPIIDVEDGVLALYPSGEGQAPAKVAEIKTILAVVEKRLIRGKDGKIFVIENGKRRHIKSLDELRRNFSGRPIKNVGDAELNSLQII